MSRMRAGWAALALVLASCAGLQPVPGLQDVAAKRFDPVTDKAVIYLFRPQLDFVRDGAGVMLDDELLATTYPATYFRLVLAPGRYRLAGFAGDSGVLDLDAQAGRLYFIEQSVVRLMRFARSNFRVVSDAYGRQAVLRCELLFSR